MLQAVNTWKLNQMAADGSLTEICNAKKATPSSRVLRELLESAEHLSAYGLVSKTDMARMKALREEPPEYSPEHLASIRGPASQR